MRQPPTEVQVVLPVWGRSYVRQFLDLCLPTLLAQGNVPALAQFAPCTFVLMTRQRDAATITSHPLWPLLEACCRIRIDLIDDLVSRSSSTVLTLAYARAIRTRGAAMADTCFLLLVSDYVVADGSLRNAAARIFAGASGVLAGNFQITVEGGRKRILDHADPLDRVVSIASRDLVELALSTLHPATIANTVDGPAAHDPSGNRLFWQVDERCMIGRFFLMHMIALRPEVTRFVVGAPSDYGLIPELCPSGAVVAITDSDEYMTVECQPASRRLPALAFGAATPSAVAASLEPWATRQHHANIAHTLVFHCGGESLGLPAAREKSDVFVAAIYRDDPPKAQPHRLHPLWARSLEHHLATAEHRDAAAAVEALTSEAMSGLSAMSLGTWRRTLLGQAPTLRPWHPRYADVTRLMSAVARLAQGSTLLIVSQAPARVRDALEATARAAGSSLVMQIDTDDVVPAREDDVSIRFDACVVLWPHDDLTELDHVLGGVGARLNAEAVIAVAIGHVFEDDPGEIASNSVLDIRQNSGSGFVVERVEGVPINGWRSSVQCAMMAFARRQVRARRFSPSWLPTLLAALLAPLSLLANLMTFQIQTIEGQRRSSSLILFFRRQSPVSVAADKLRGVSAHQDGISGKVSVSRKSSLLRAGGRPRVAAADEHVLR